jgi:hypothetical protein
MSDNQEFVKKLNIEPASKLKIMNPITRKNMSKLVVLSGLRMIWSIDTEFGVSKILK